MAFSPESFPEPPEQPRSTPANQPDFNGQPEPAAPGVEPTELRARPPGPPEPNADGEGRRLHARPPEAPTTTDKSPHSIAPLLRRIPWLNRLAAQPQPEQQPDPSVETTPDEAVPEEADELPPPDASLADRCLFYGTYPANAAAREDVAAIAQEDPVPGELKPTEGEERAIGGMQAVAVAMCERLGLDVSDRTPVPVHIVSDVEATTNELDTEYHGEIDYTIDAGIMVGRGNTDAETARLVAGRMADALGALHIFPEHVPVEGGDDQYNLNVRPGLSVLVQQVDYADQDQATFLRGYRSLVAHRVLAGTEHGTQEPLHPRESVVLDGVIRAVSRQTGESPQQIEGALLRGHVTGRMSDGRVLHAGLTHSTARKVFSHHSLIPAEVSTGNGTDLLKSLGFDEQAAEIEAERAAGTYRYFNWQAP